MAAIFVCGPFVCCIVMGTVFTHLLQMPLQHIKVVKLSTLSRNTIHMGGEGIWTRQQQSLPHRYHIKRGRNTHLQTEGCYQKQTGHTRNRVCN